MADLAQTLQHSDFTLESAHAGIRAAFADRIIGIGRLPIQALKVSRPSPVAAGNSEPAPECYALMGLGSHGATHAPLAAEAIASSLCGAPSPLPRELSHLTRLNRF